MVDFHSHILPAVDDGSKDIEESAALLSMLSQQGIKTVVATPHFLPERESVEEFLLRRQSAYEELRENLTADTPQILLGAEVAYYEGVSYLSNLSKLTIGDSKLLLIEMPMRKWSETSVRELTNLACSNTVTVVLAHIERYLPFNNKEAINTLLDCGVLLQVNASFFNELKTRRKALKFIRDGSVHFIGSDCHNLRYRPPMIGQAYSLISKKLGDGFMQDFTEYQTSLLNISDNG